MNKFQFSIISYVDFFFQFHTTDDPYTNTTQAVPTDLRKDSKSKYVVYYMVWSKFFVADLFPFLSIVVLNSMIVIHIFKTSRTVLAILANNSDVSHKRVRKANCKENHRKLCTNLPLLL